MTTEYRHPKGRHIRRQLAPMSIWIIWLWTWVKIIALWIAWILIVTILVAYLATAITGYPYHQVTP